MRAYELLTEAASPHLVHLEDMILDDGYAGAQAALRYASGVRNVLSLGKGGRGQVTVKWDGCLHEDTIILTADNSEVTISDYVNNKMIDKVLAHNFETNTDEFVNVLGKYSNFGEKDWVEIGLANGETICLTEDHEIYTTNRGWIAAGKLQEGDDIQESTVK